MGFRAFFVMLSLLGQSALASPGGYGDPVPNPPSVCALQTEDSQGGVVTFCSATLVQNGFLVTAAHCMIRQRYRAKLDPEFEEGRVFASCPNPGGGGLLPPVRVPVTDPSYMDAYLPAENWKKFDAFVEKTMADKLKSLEETYGGKVPTEAIERLVEETLLVEAVRDLWNDLRDESLSFDVATLRFEPALALVGSKAIRLDAKSDEIQALLRAGSCVVSGYGYLHPESERKGDAQEGKTIGVQFSIQARRDCEFGKKEEAGQLLCPVDEVSFSGRLTLQGREREIVRVEPYNTVLSGDSGGSVLCKDVRGDYVLAGVVSGVNSTRQDCVAGTCFNRHTLLGDTESGEWIRKGHRLVSAKLREREESLLPRGVQNEALVKTAPGELTLPSGVLLEKSRGK